MNVSHWVPKTKAIGPGNRLGIWLSGCKKSCKNCISPELKDSNSGCCYAPSLLAAIINLEMQANQIDGITISGGEPLDQIEDLLIFIKQLSVKDILIYTGYSYEWVKEQWFWVQLSSRIACIVTDPYIDELNDGCSLRGSSNQRIQILDSKYFKRYKVYIEEKRQVELYSEEDRIIIVGFPPQNFEKSMKQSLRRK